jgi:hypothetical protein
MRHRTALIIQTIFIGLYILSITFDWPGAIAILVFGWTYTIGFYIIKTLGSLLKKQFLLSVVYFMFVLLTFSIPTKITFVYYNLIVHFILISGFLFLIYKRIELDIDKHFKILICLIVTINVVLLFTNDNFVSENLFGNDTFKSNSSDLNWEHFNKADHIEGNYHAEIDAGIYYNINKVFNYTAATAVAKIKLENNYYVYQADDLLEHELYHFKIAELVTRRLNNELDKCYFNSYDKTKVLIEQYLDTLGKMQAAYDKETEHNLNTEKQRQWKAWVDKELNK